MNGVWTMPELRVSRRVAVIATILMAANIAPVAARAATAIGHASVTILPAVAAVSETTPIEVDGVGNRLSIRPGIVILTGAPNIAIAISITANDDFSGTGPALRLAPFTHNGGRTPVLNRDGSLSLAIATTVKKGTSQPQGAYSGSYSVIVNY